MSRLIFLWFFQLNWISAVTAVAHGLEAWKILEDPTNHIDLVLTEVAMPYLSGIGLLSMIMNHKTYKNIPVISEFLLQFSVMLFYVKNILFMILKNSYF